MALRDILLCVEDSRVFPARAEFAARVAARHQAHLAALYAFASVRLPASLPADLLRTALELDEDLLRNTAERLAETVRAAAQRHGVDIEWRRIESASHDIAVLHARHADLTVTGQPATDERLEDGPEPELLHALLLSSGRPVLVVPRHGTFEVCGDHVLVAWNGTREAARAVADAMPILVAADKVTVLSVNPAEGSDRRIPGADIGLHLARHGVNAAVTATTAEDIEAGDVLLSRAADLGADLIVMGAYGRSRFREIVLGGVTRHMLRHMTVPVLLSH